MTHRTILQHDSHSHYAKLEYPLEDRLFPHVRKKHQDGLRLSATNLVVPDACVGYQLHHS